MISGLGSGCLSRLPRKRKSPRPRTGRGWVRERFEAVEMPLKRTKKSQNARNGPFFFSVGMGKNLAGPAQSPWRSTPFEQQQALLVAGSFAVAVSSRINSRNSVAPTGLMELGRAAFPGRPLRVAQGCPGVFSTAPSGSEDRTVFRCLRGPREYPENERPSVTKILVKHSASDSKSAIVPIS